MKEKKLMTIMIGMRRTGDIMQSDEDDDEPRQGERGSMEHSIEQLRETHANSGDEDGVVTFIGGITLDVSDAGNYEVVDPEDDDEYYDSDDDESDDSDGGGFNPNEENWEAEDMPGDNADEREEAFDNHDWDAADG